MDLQSIYKTTGTVLLVVAGILLAAVIVLLVMVLIPKIRAARHGKPENISAGRHESKDGKTGAKPLRGQYSSGTASLSDRADTTVVRAVPRRPSEAVTLRLDKTGGLTENPDSGRRPVPIEQLRQQLGFKPEICVLKFSSDEKI